jgi:hypothetical protein
MTWRRAKPTTGRQIRSFGRCEPEGVLRTVARAAHIGRPPPPLGRLAPTPTPFRP